MEPTTPQSNRDKLSIPIAIIFAGILVAGAIIFSDSEPRPKEALEIPDRKQVGADTNEVPTSLLALRANDHVLGSPEAEVLVIEFSDTECPFCKMFHETMTQVMDFYGKTGSVAWVYRHFPLDQSHPKARKEAEALECAGELGGNAIFWKYTNRLFELTPSNNGLDAAKLPIIASELGLNVGRFEECLSSGRYVERVQSDFENGVNVGVKGTPYTVVWNRSTGKQMPVSGSYSYDDMKTILGIVSAK